MLSDYIVKKYSGGVGLNAAARAKTGKTAGFIGIALNTVLFCAKLITGILARSVSVIADAVNNLSDASSNVITCLGFKMASRPADKEHPYGHGRYEYLAALFIAVLIMVLGAELLAESVRKIISPVPTVFSWVTVGILAFSVAVKLWMCAFNKRLGRLISSQALSAAATDSLCDVVATTVILAAAVISNYVSVDLDGAMGIAVALFVLYSGFTTVKKTVDPLLGRAPDKKFAESVKERILGYDGVSGTHDLMVHDYGAGRQFASVHVEMPAELGILKCHEIIDRIERDFLQSDGLHLVVHLDPLDGEMADGKTRLWLEECAKSVDGRLTVHDLKINVCGDTTKLIFDCAAPDVPLEKDEIKRRICEEVKKLRPDCECEITVDSDYYCISD